MTDRADGLTLVDHDNFRFFFSGWSFRISHIKKIRFFISLNNNFNNNNFVLLRNYNLFLKNYTDKNLKKKIRKKNRKIFSRIFFFYCFEMKNLLNYSLAVHVRMIKYDWYSSLWINSSIRWHDHYVMTNIVRMPLCN